MVNISPRTTTGHTTTTGGNGSTGKVARVRGGERRWNDRTNEPGPAERQHLASGVGRLLREHRATTGLSLRRLATEAGVSIGLLSMLERGLRRPRPATLGALAAILDPDQPAELTARLIDAAGSSIRPDTASASRARRRRARRAGRRRYESWRAAVDLDQAARERLVRSAAAVDWRLLLAADRADAPPALVDGAHRALIAAAQEAAAARRMQAEAERRLQHLGKLPARTIHRNPAA